MFKEALLKMLGDLGDFLAVLFKKGIHDELKLILPIALNAVKTVAADASLVGGDAKFNAAFALVSAGVAGGQKDIASSLINLGIELAYQKMQAQAAAAAPGK